MAMFGNSAPVSIAPAAVDPSTVTTGPQVPQAPAMNSNPGFWSTLGEMLVNGGTPGQAQLAIRQRDYQSSMLQAMPQIINSLPDDQRRAAMLNFPGFVENYEKGFGPQGVKAGDSVQYGGPGGPMTTAPLMGFDPVSGRPYTQTPTAAAPTAPSLGGGYKADNGVVLSDRTGPAGTYSTPQILPPGSTPGQFSPTVGGGMFGSGAPGAIAPAPPAAAAPGQGPAVPQVPRSARNNNPGNVTALPNGQMWNGQVGTDPGGFAIFDSPASGQAAASTNLRSYAARHGINTVAGVINRWAPQAGGNDTPAYIAAVSKGLGVAPDQPLNMADPNVHQALLQQIFGHEGGGAAAAGGSVTPPGVGSAPPPGGGWSTGAQVGTPRVLSPDETQQLGYAPGTVLERDAAGHVSVSQQPQYDANWAKGQRELFANTESYKQNDAAAAALKALTANTGKLTGPAAYSILDTFARTINPGAVARQGTLSAIEESLGIPAKVLGAALNASGKGNLPLKTQQDLVDAVTPFAQSHWDQAKQAYDAQVALGQQHGFKEGEMTLPIGAKPERMAVTPAGAVSARQAQAQSAQVLAQARQAIAKGAPRAQVIQRVQAMNIDPAGL